MRAAVYLQLGAFGSRENAESYLARAKVQVEWLAQSMHLFPRDGLYRVHAGPYASSGEARLAADRVGVALGAETRRRYALTGGNVARKRGYGTEVSLCSFTGGGSRRKSFGYGGKPWVSLCFVSRIVFVSSSLLTKRI